MTRIMSDVLIIKNTHMATNYKSYSDWYNSLSEQEKNNYRNSNLNSGAGFSKQEIAKTLGYAGIKYNPDTASQTPELEQLAYTLEKTINPNYNKSGGGGMTSGQSQEYIRQMVQGYGDTWTTLSDTDKLNYLISGVSPSSTALKDQGTVQAAATKESTGTVTTLQQIRNQRSDLQSLYDENGNAVNPSDPKVAGIPTLQDWWNQYGKSEYPDVSIQSTTQQPGTVQASVQPTTQETVKTETQNLSGVEIPANGMGRKVYQSGSDLYYATTSGFQKIKNPTELKELSASGFINTSLGYAQLPANAVIVGQTTPATTPAATSTGELPAATNQPTSAPTATNTLKAYDQQGNEVYVEPGKYYQGISPTKPTTEPAITTQEAQTKIADIQNLTGDEKTTAILDFMKTAIEAGASYDDITTYLKSLSEPAQTEEERKAAIYEKYGISELEEEAFATPTETFETIYKKAYDDAGLGEIKNDMDIAQAELDEMTADYNEAVGKINENPWISEAGRTGKIRRIYEAYSAEATRLQNKITTLSNEYERGQDRAYNMSSQALSELEQGQTRTKEELNYYIQRAEADLEAENAIAEEEQDKELLRYFPEYVEAYKQYQTEIAEAESKSEQFKIENELLTVAEAEKLGVPYGTTKGEVANKTIVPKSSQEPLTRTIGGNLYQYNETTGGWELAIQGTTGGGGNKELSSDEQMMQAMLNDGAFDAGGYISDEDYTFYRNQWINAGLNPTTFDSKFKGVKKSGSTSGGIGYDDL